LVAAGWGFGGPVDRRRNRPVCNFHESGWERIDATKALAKALALPVFIENDCKVAALAEAQLGAGSPHGLTAYLTLGSGVGGGLIWNGRILAAGPRGEAEIGHLCVVPGGARCACGRRGCLEAYCSGWGVGARAAEAAAAMRRRPALAKRLLAAEPRERAAILFSGWPDDAFARQQIGLFLTHLADACAALCLLVAPSRLVLGGGVAQQPWLAGALAPLIEARLPAVLRGHTQVRRARLGARSVSCGAALYARDRFGDDAACKE
jgi:glucokinase